MTDSADAGAPAADVDDGGVEGADRRRPGWLVPGAIVIGVLVVALVVAVVVAATRSDPAYDDATQERFVEACVADGGEGVRPACECLYAAIVEQIPYDRFVEVDDQLRAARAAGEPIVLPDDVAALLDGCRVEA